MSQGIDCHTLVDLLSQVGAKKASMSDFAKAAGVTRQTLYNRFGTKDALRGWAILEFMRQVNDTAIDCLDTAQEGRPLEAIEHAFDRWGADHVQRVFHAPHGIEILEAGILLITNLPETPINDFETQLGAFIAQNNLAPSPSQAAMVLVFAAKGVFVSSPEKQTFSDQMKQIIRTVLS